MSSSFPLKPKIYNTLWIMCPNERGYNAPILIHQGDPWILVSQNKICAPVHDIFQQKPILWSGSLDALNQVRMLVGSYGWLEVRGIFYDVLQRELRNAPLPDGEWYIAFNRLGKSFWDRLRKHAEQFRKSVKGVSDYGVAEMILFSLIPYKEDT